MPRGMSLFGHIPAQRSCEDAQIEAHWCSCLNWIDINVKQLLPQPKARTDTLTSVYSRLVVYLATRAVEFINSLIDDEYKKYCERLEVLSIERVSRLNVNKQLLEFKKSKDIHGREAVFEEFDMGSVAVLERLLEEGGLDAMMEKTASDGGDLVNGTSGGGVANGTSGDRAATHMSTYVNSEINFQIVLMTAPNNASYELSFKYNVYDGLFRFNRNEISRINSYNNTANCMLDKRPDLRQFCYCKQV